MTGTQASRSRSRLALLALLATLPLVAATVGGVIHASPASAATTAQVLHLMDANGATVADRSGHGGDHHGDRSEHSDRGDHGDRGDRHNDGDRHHDEGDHHGAECHNCGVDNGDHRSGDNGGDRDHNGDQHHGEGNGCSPRRESLLEALLDGLCTGAEELERALTGAK